jgi:ABC-type nickel/cobalt efflux system permease component RcnA
MKPRHLFLVLIPAAIYAHPMGNFSVSHYTRLEVSARGVDVTYALDLAEVPTYTLLRDWKLDAKSPQLELEAKATEQAQEWAKGLEFEAAGKPVQPKFVRAEIKLSDGAGGLSVARIEARFELAEVRSPLSFEDHNFPERAGWKEIVIRSGEGASITKASHPDVERSKALTEYPADPTSAPPQDLRASVEWKTTANPIVSEAPRVIVPIEQPKPAEAVAAAPPPSSTPNAPQPPGTVVKGDYLSRLIAMKQIPLSWLLAGLVVAFGFGAAHALTPGHGKTIVAAYLVGSRGTLKHAAFLGAMVTFTHTITVFLLGLGVLFLSNIVKPEKITPILGAISGLSIVAVGASLFYKRFRRLRAAAHSHDHHHHHDHDHHHEHARVHAHSHSHAHSHVHEHHHHDHAHHHSHDHDHDHGPHGHSHVPEGEITWGSLIALGASGGLVPCPSALVLLLASISFGHVGVGLILLIAFSIGLAGVLMAIGMMVLYAKTWLPDPAKTSRHPAFRLVPVVSAAVIVCLGLLMTGVSLGWVKPGLVG